MKPTVIIVHGLGDKTHDYGGSFDDILQMDNDKILRFYYEDLLEDSKWNKFVKLVSFGVSHVYSIPTFGVDQIIADYLDDIQVYRGSKIFGGRRTRKRIIKRLRDLLLKHENAVVIGHSLGSLVVYDTFQHFPELAEQNHSFISVGSPLGGTIGELWERVALWLPKGRTKDLIGLVSSWTNIYSKRDVISGRIDSQFMVNRQVKIRTHLPNFHAIEQYLKFIADSGLLEKEKESGQ